MNILNRISNFFTVRYKDGSFWIGNDSNTKYMKREYMRLYKSNYALNTCVNIGANYASRFKWGIKEKDGTINYDDPLLDIIKNPNPYQTTVDLIKQLYIYKTVYGWAYQKPFSARGYDPETIYNLNPELITFDNSKRNPLLVWKRSSKKEISQDEFKYDDNGTVRDYRFSEVLKFYDQSNGLGTDKESMYTSPSKVESIIKNISNLELGLDGENVIIQTIGREVMHTASVKRDAERFTSGVTPITDTERKDIDNKLNNKSFLKSRRLRTFTPRNPIEHKDLSLKLKDYDLDTSISKQETIIARSLGIPLELYQAYKSNSKFENRHEAIVEVIDNINESFIQDIAKMWTKSFGDINRPYVATIDHIRSMKKEENKKADTALKITTAILNLQRAGLDNDKSIDVLNELGIEFTRDGR